MAGVKFHGLAKRCLPASALYGLVDIHCGKWFNRYVLNCFTTSWLFLEKRIIIIIKMSEGSFQVNLYSIFGQVYISHLSLSLWAFP